jgi:hypothetical protein
MAGFEVIIYGRFWVITEAGPGIRKQNRNRKDGTLLRDTFCTGERFCVIPVGVVEGRLNAVEPARPSAGRL